MSVRTFTVRPPAIESRNTFECFGGTCTVIVADARRPADAAEAAAAVKRTLLDWHQAFSRFERDSELSRFNRDPRTRVPVSPMLRRLIEAALTAARDTGGLVDATLGTEIERAGYASHLDATGLALERSLSLAPPRAPAGPGAVSLEQRIAIDRDASVVTRQRGTVLDLGGIAKGVFADQTAASLAGFDAFAVDCAGDIRLGGRAEIRRAVHITSPFDSGPLHTFALSSGGIATSGTSKRSWVGPDGRAGHHLLDPRTGRPAFTGVVQATALAPTAAQAEMLAKAALLSGPEQAAQWLRYGGMFVREDGSYEVLEAAARGDSRPVRSTSSTAAFTLK